MTPGPDSVPTSRVLVTGATGYIGSRLVPALLERGHEVVAATRRESSLRDYPWGDRVTPRVFDIEDDEIVAAAVKDVDAVVYLVHSMTDGDFVRKDREAAERVAAACEAAGVGRIVYLSGLVPPGDLTDHLRSRLQVEETFLDCEVPAIVLRAAMVIGSGSTSYELLRRLSERIPLVTPVPTWMRSRLQPVSVDDVMHLLVRAVEVEVRNTHYDVGGDEVLTYPELLALFADVAGLRRVRLPVPLLPPTVVGRASAAISGMQPTEVTALVRSLREDMVCREDAVRRELADPDHEFTSVADALRRSLRGARDDAPDGTAIGADPAAAAPAD